MTKAEAYQILRLPAGSDPQEIKKAYAELAAQYHPEEHPREFMEIQAAYKTLTEGPVFTGDLNGPDEMPHGEDFQKDQWDDVFAQMDWKYENRLQTELARQREARKKRLEEEHAAREKKRGQSLELLAELRELLAEAATYKRRKKLRELLVRAADQELLFTRTFADGLGELCSQYDISFQLYKIMHYCCVWKGECKTETEKEIRQKLMQMLGEKKALAPDEVMAFSWNQRILMIACAAVLCIGEGMGKALCSMGAILAYALAYRFLRVFWFYRWSTAHLFCSMSVLLLFDSSFAVRHWITEALFIWCGTLAICMILMAAIRTRPVRWKNYKIKLLRQADKGGSGR